MTDLQRQAAAARPLPIALAHAAARCKPGDARLELLNRIYVGSKKYDQLRYQAELHRVKAARRGETLSHVA